MIGLGAPPRKAATAAPLAPVPDESVSPTPRSKIRARTREPSTEMNETLVRFGNSSVLRLDRRPDRGEVERLDLVAGLDHALRIADVDVLKAPLAPGRLERPGAVGRTAGVVGRGHRGPPDRHRDLARAGDRRRHLAGLGQDRERVLVGPAGLPQVEDRLAGAVARELGLGAVRVEDPQLGDVAVVRGPRRAAGSRRSRRRSGARRSAGSARGVSSQGSASASQTM